MDFFASFRLEVLGFTTFDTVTISSLAVGWYHGVVPTHGRGATVTCCPEGISASLGGMHVLR